MSRLQTGIPPHSLAQRDHRRLITARLERIPASTRSCLRPDRDYPYFRRRHLAGRSEHDPLIVAALPRSHPKMALTEQRHPERIRPFFSSNPATEPGLSLWENPRAINHDSER